MAMVSKKIVSSRMFACGAQANMDNDTTLYG